MKRNIELVILITVIVIFVFLYGPNAIKNTLRDFLIAINSGLLTSSDVNDKILNDNEKLVLKYLSCTGSPDYRKGVDKYLSPSVVYYGTGRGPNDKEYVLKRLKLWRSLQPYNKDVIVMIQNVGNTIYVVRRNHGSPGRYTLYTFQVNNGKITQYSKMMDYLYGTTQNGYIGEISRSLVNRITHV